MEPIIENLKSKNSNSTRRENMGNNKFSIKLLKEDTKQFKKMKESYTNLVKENNIELMNNSYETLNDKLDYIECINGNCSKVNNENIVNKEKSLDQQKNTYRTNSIRTNLDILVSLVYIFLLVILLLGSVIKRDVNNLINILVITLIYLFYQIYISYKN